MIVGKLNTKVTIDRAVTAKDTYGGSSITYDLVVSTWCEVVSTKAMERYEAFHKSEKTEKVIKIRDRDSLATLKHEDMRATIKGIKYRISNWYREYEEIIFFCEVDHVVRD